MPDTPTPYDPSTPLRADATDAEFDAACQAAERAKIEQETRAAVREALWRLAKGGGWTAWYDYVLSWRDREYPPLPERNEL